MICTRSTCGHKATRIIAWAMTGPAIFVAPYCEEHADEVEREQRGVPACGPALSEEARKIEGRR